MKKDNIKKVRTIAKQISFLMPHQVVLPDLKEIAEQLKPTAIMSPNSHQYLSGAHDALIALLEFLAEKGHQKI